MRSLALSACLASLLVTPLAAQRPAPPAPVAPADVDAIVARAMRSFEVPGIALAIVKDGQVVVAKGYGVRKLGDAAPVDARTRFGIASNSKLFTATALAMLVEEGKLEWEAPVTRYLPGFALADPFVTRELTVRDLLVHRSGLGLGAGDLLWWPTTDFSRKEIAERLRWIQPTTSFRSAYAYDNVLYLVAGELVQAVTGMTWERFVASRILEPLGMTGTRTDVSSVMEQGANVAWPHARVEGRVRPVAPFTGDNSNPAAGINASAADITKWMMAQLDSGRAGDRALWAPRSTRELWQVVTPLRASTNPELRPIRQRFAGYALGLNVTDYRGWQKLHHTGGLPGFVSMITMVPDQRLGIAVFTNQESGEAFSAITNQLLDHYLRGGAPAVDWIAAYERIRARNDSSVAAVERAAAASRDSSSRPSLPLARYAGSYTDPWYGDVTIALEGGRLVMRFSRTPMLVGTLEHWQYDTFVVRWNDRETRADAWVTFALNPDGSIDQVKMAPASPSVDFSFDFQDLLLRPKKTK
ncbi:MAG TPA: serine hydrolase [Gemmatimonadaceae bacterium]